MWLYVIMWASGKRTALVEVEISLLSPLAMDILLPGDLLDELDAAAGALLLQARHIAASRQDAEDVVTLKIPHHIAALASPYMPRFHHQFEIHLLPRFIFLIAIIIVED
jgi:hypothetical protein